MTTPVRPTARRRRAALLSVLLPLPLAGAYDYRAAGGSRSSRPAISSSCRSAAARSSAWSGARAAARSARAKLRDVVARLDAPPPAGGARRFVDWVAHYTLAPPGAVLRMAMRVPAALEPPRGDRRLAAQRRCGAARRACASPPRAGACSTCSPTDRRGRRRNSRARPASAPASSRRWRPRARCVPVELPPPAGLRGARSRARRPDAERGAGRRRGDACRARSRPAASRSRCSTASPARARPRSISRRSPRRCARGRQALVLLPEIALGAQWLERFAARFGARAGAMAFRSDVGASAASPGAPWRAGEARVVVGARSALFLPFPDLGLIVVDEEHDTAFKQEDGVVYQARDMAVVRARLGRHPVVLVSATPSLETVQQCRARPLRRAASAATATAAPRCRSSRAIDLRRDKPPRAAAGCRRRCAQALSETLAAGEQALLFLNRRGYAPLTLCRACGHRMQCPNCTAWLVEHRLRRAAAMPSLRLCRRRCRRPARPAAPRARWPPAGPASSGSPRRWRRCFPAARTAMMTSDTITGPARGGGARPRAIADARGRPADRHADRRQGPSLPDADPGRRGRCRSRPRRRRSARGRAHLSAAAPGRRPRRPRRAAGPRAAADLRCRSIR